MAATCRLVLLVLVPVLVLLVMLLLVLLVLLLALIPATSNATKYAQELLKGRRGQLLPESQVVALFIQICLALKHIHDRKVGQEAGWVG